MAKNPLEKISNFWASITFRTNIFRTDFSYRYFSYGLLASGGFRGLIPGPRPLFRPLVRRVPVRKVRTKNNCTKSTCTRSTRTKSTCTKNNCTEQLYEKFVRTTIVQKVILPRRLVRVRVPWSGPKTFAQFHITCQKVVKNV